MARFAVLLGVSDYQRQAPLPAARNDASLMHSVLVASGNYEDILLIPPDSAQSETVKHLVTSFVQKHRARDDVEEVFFYFSGHGQYLDDEFYYVLSDYDEARRNKTSLRNSELDGFLRTLGATVAVKVVDACNAGVQYVKDAGNLNAVLEKGAKHGFNKIYFLYSCLADQQSFCDSSISFFTKSFLKAIVTHGRPEIRYRDIIDQITDDFAATANQRPYYVIQADNTEIFATFSPTVKQTISDQMTAMVDVAGGSKPIVTRSPSLADLIKEQAKDYLSADELEIAASKIPAIAEEYPFSQETRELFDVQVSTSDSFDDLPNLESLGKWVAERKSNYLAKPIIRIEEYMGYPNSLYAQLAVFGADERARKVKKTRQVYSGFERAWKKPPYCRLTISFNSKYPNLRTHVLDIAFVLSPKDITYFYMAQDLWSKDAALYPMKREIAPWKSREGLVRELLGDAANLKTILSEFDALTIELVRQAAGVPSEPSPRSTPDAKSEASSKVSPRNGGT